MSRFSRIAATSGAALLCLGTFASRPTHADDGIFPPAPAAKSFIDFDGRGFLVQGKRTFLASGGMEYARVPRGLWKDRLQRLKRAGMNTVEIYVFWNYHEPTEGKFDFSGEKDLDAFLKLVKQMGMYAIVRPGPYVCAEWDGGGYPVWLRFKPGMRVREDNAAFKQYVDRFWDKALPVIAANQIHRGGSVVLVQLENEHPQGWGKEMPNGYFEHLRDRAIALGIEVPYFFSGLHHSADPAGNRPWDSAGRTNPWFSTEFWPGWYDLYGPLDKNGLRRFDRGTWKIIAYGGNGYNYYMMHGGTNFAYWNNQEDASSYDYGAAVGQAGDLRPIYYRFKRAAWFARSFQNILEDSENATAAFQGAASNSAVRVTARRSNAGTILFLDNPGETPLETQVKSGDTAALPAAGSLTLAPGEIMPIVRDYMIAPGVTLKSAPTRILGSFAQGETTTLVIYGPVGSPAELYFTVPTGAVIGKGKDALTVAAPGQIALKTRFATGAPTEYSFSVNGQRVRVLAVRDTLADNTWFIESPSANYVVCGPAYIAEASVDKGRLRLVTETPWDGSADTPAVAFGPNDGAVVLTAISAKRPANRVIVPVLSTWEARSATEPSQRGFSDADWKTSDATPLPMGADGDISSYAWYRATLRVPAAGTYSLSLTGARDAILPFIDGASVASANRSASTIPVTLSAGEHTLSLFASHSGRDKLFNYLGPLEGRDVKGLAGPVALRQTDGDGIALDDWHILPIAGKPGPPPLTDAPGWASASIGKDAFGAKRGSAWFQTTLPADAGAAQGRTLHFEGVDDNATVYLNGTRIGAHQGWSEPFDIALGTGWLAGKPNVLTVLVDNTDNTGGIMGAVTLARYKYDRPVTGWKLRGGPGDPLAADGWKTLTKTEKGVAGPTFYRTQFTVSPPTVSGPHPILRIETKGLSRGSVWLNGHNLGRYPERVPVDGIYLPEVWLQNGKNSLVIFDEEGNRPEAVAIRIETAASRMSEELTTP